MSEAISPDENMHFSIVMSSVARPTDTIHNEPLNSLKTEANIMVLTYCLQQLSIISSIIPASIKSSWYEIIRYRTLEERYGGPRIEKVLLPEAQGLQNISSVEKLQRDLVQIMEILRSLIDELREFRTYGTLSKINKMLTQMNDEEDQLVTQCLDNIQTVRNLKNAFQLTLKTNKERLHQLTKRMFELDNEVHDAELKVQITERFANHWENTRYSQNLGQLKQLEGVIEKETKDAEDRMANEKRTHDEIEKYLLLNMNNMNEEGDQWLRRFEEEAEKLFADTRNLDSKRAAQLAEYRQTKADFEFKLQEMHDWVTDRDDRAQKAEHERMIQKAATKIQAWWRGRMVQHFLGPFKKLKAIMSKKKAAAEKKGKGKGKGK